MTKFTTVSFACALMASAALSLPASAKIATGSSVANMTVTDSNGKTHELSDFAGKTVVLEWTNHGCPYVKKHYDPAYENMQNMQKEAAADDVVWLSIVSSAPGKQGYVTGQEANDLTTSRSAAPKAVVLDPSGTAGRTFAAKTTPHMYVIDAAQTLVYQGAIDSNRSARSSAIPGATNYVREALAAVKSGVAVKNAETAPYGCSIKYGS